MKSGFLLSAVQKQFVTGNSPYLINSKPNSPFFVEGDLAGQPRFQTAALNPFMQWAKICRDEAVDALN